MALLWRFFVASALLVLLLAFRYFGDETISELRQAALGGVIAAEYLSVLLGLGLRQLWRFRSRALRLLVALELAFDLSALLLLIYFSGGIFSEFLALFVFVSLASAGLIKTPLRYGVLGMAGVSLLLLGFANWLGYGHELPLLPATDIAPTLMVRSFYYIGIIALGSGFAAYLARYAEKARADLAATTLGLQQMRLYNEQILAAIPSGLILAEPKSHHVVFANATAQQILGPALPSSVAQMLTVGDASLRVRGEVETPQGQILGFSTTDVALPGARSTRAAQLLMFQDVTRYRRLERQLETQEKMAAIGRLGANLAHEIRNPLTSISNAIQLLQSRKPTDTATAELLAVAGSEIARLEKLLTDFLSFAKPGGPSGHGHIEIFEPRSVLHGILAHVPKPAGADFGLAESGTMGRISGNRTVYHQVAYNLILNASQWADAAHPVVRCHLSIQDERLQLRVEDNGPGVPAAQRALVWEPFYTARPSGTGLGLALVATLASSVDGAVECSDSTELGGAAFVFSMPCSLVPEN